MDLSEGPGAGIPSETFVWLVGSLCHVNRIPFDASLLLQQYPAPHTIATVLDAAHALGFKTGEGELASATYPCIGFLASSPSKPALLVSSPPQPALLVARHGERLVYFLPSSPAPQTCASDAIAGLFARRVLLLNHEAPSGVDDAAAGAPRPSFGFSWFRAELLRHKRVWRDVLVASLFIQLIALATPLFTQVVIDKVVVHQTRSTLIVVAIALGMFLLFNAAMSWLRQYFVLHTGNRVDAVLGSQVFRHLLRLHLPYFEARPTGTLVARLQAVETIREFMAGAAVALLLDLPFLAIFVAVMFAYSWQLTLIALGALALIAALSIGIVPQLRVRLNQQFLLGARNQAFLTEYVAGMETVKSLQMEPRLESRYDGYLAGYLAAGFRTRQLSNSYNTVANSLEQAMTLAILCVGALIVMGNEGFTIGMLVAFQMFASRMSQPMLRLAGLWQEFQQASIAVRRLGDIMDAPAEPYTLAPARAVEGPGAIEVAGLSFRYSAGQPLIFRGLDLSLKPGRLIVLTGPSGSGKSTLARLLLGFYQPCEGRITIDGRDLHHLAANELRQYFGVVPQETFLFSGTLYENLIAANPNATFEEVAQACRIAEIHDFIEKLPKGYHAEIGEHGTGLSGGQKQRLAIARALLKRPRVLIFDEATSNLDQRTAEQFAQTVNGLKGKVTMLFIAHQLPKALQVDELATLGGSDAPA